MIDQVFDIIRLNPNNNNVNLNDIIFSSGFIFDTNLDKKPRLQSWNYRSADGCLSYIQTIFRPSIIMATQQCARLFNQPNQKHKEVVQIICRYLQKTTDKGLDLRSDAS